MAEELQSLLEKIQRNGIEKAAAERDEMLKKAQEKFWKFVMEKYLILKLQELSLAKTVIQAKKVQLFIQIKY